MSNEINKDSYVPIEKLSPQIQANAMLYLPNGLEVNISNLIFRVISANEKKRTITFELIGINTNAFQIEESKPNEQNQTTPQ